MSFMMLMGVYILYGMHYMLSGPNELHSIAVLVEELL